MSPCFFFFFPPRAGKFLAARRCCFGLLHYSARSTAAPWVCVPPVAESAARCLVDSCDIVLVLLPQAAAALEWPWTRATPEIAQLKRRRVQDPEMFDETFKPAALGFS